MARKFLNVKVFGIKKTAAFLTTKNIQMKQKAETGMKQAGAYVKDEVKASIEGKRPEPRSVDTGDFLKSVDVVQSGMKVEIFTPLDYPRGLEYGTSKVPARRHFNNSKDRTQHQVENIVGLNMMGL